jgi:hypothetical protein
MARAAGPPATCSPEGTLCIYEQTGYSGGYDDYTYGSSNKNKWVGRMSSFAASIYNYRNDYRTWISNYTGGPPAGGQQACLVPGANGYGFQSTDLYGIYYSTGSGANTQTIYKNLRGYYLSSSSASCGGWVPWEPESPVTSTSTTSAAPATTTATSAASTTSQTSTAPGLPPAS